MLEVPVRTASLSMKICSGLSQILVVPVRTASLSMKTSKEIMAQLLSSPLAIRPGVRVLSTLEDITAVVSTPEENTTVFPHHVIPRPSRRALRANSVASSSNSASFSAPT